MIPSAGLRSLVVRAARAAAALVAVLCACAGPVLAQTSAPAASGPAFGHAVVVQRDGEPVLQVDGKPFFFWGAAFFYERLPASRWAFSMRALRTLGVNTLDLYVPWNWHELSDGDFDFDGRTNPRRNLRAVLRLAREMGFHIVVRPGPVIRNEWRNGGYPAWLLQRPEYGMPLHDVLEGRYPATATLQNAHSDDAAAEWMRNATHMRYASRWLHRALEEFRPVADLVLAVQLDDDQGAYIDNQTYPAPHLQAYLRWLEAQARDVVGPATPAFINTYEMRVPASSPVWTMGNWYQSDAYAIGEHDRVALDVATAMLRTNRRGPLAMSEFQAGWLASPEDPQPRPADPANTTLALYELLAWGVHGVIDFPMQDTLAPFGWEAPFSNALYAWDAALRYPWQSAGETFTTDEARGVPLRGSRFDATREIGLQLQTFGPLLAGARRVTDVVLAYPGSSYPGDAAAGAQALARFREHVRECTDRGTPCEIVDLAATTADALRRFRVLVVDDDRTRRMHSALLRRFREHGTVAAAVPALHWPGTILRGRDATFLVAVNWTDAPRHETARRIQTGGAAIDLPAFDVPARSGRLIALDLRGARADAGGARVPDLRSESTIAVPGETYDDVLLSRHTLVTLADVFPPSSGAETYRTDAFADGSNDVVLQNRMARVVIVPDGGARAPVFALLPAIANLRDRYAPDGEASVNAFDATGGLRDDVLVQPPPSPTDRIARYTHSYPAGTFNRTYAVTGARSGSVHLTAGVPDVVPAGATFERIVSLAPDAARLVVDERARFGAGPGAGAQRAVVLSALAAPTARDGTLDAEFVDADGTVANGRAVRAPAGVALLRRSRTFAWIAVAVSWRPGDVESASWEPHRSNGTLRMVLAPGFRRVTYSLAQVDTRAAALRFAEAERAWAAANPAPGP
jgi:Glycosyl hydrolases family 35